MSHNPTRPVDKDRAEAELNLAIKKATNPDETAPKQKHVRSESRHTKWGESSLLTWSLLRATDRGDRLHVGLSILGLDLVGVASSAHLVGRSSNVQGVDHDPQGATRRPRSRESFYACQRQHVAKRDSASRDDQVLKEAQNQTSWLETCARTVGGDVSRGRFAHPLALLKRSTTDVFDRKQATVL